MHLVLTKDVHIATNKMKFVFVLRTSKTHGLESALQLVKFTACGKKHNLRKKASSSICPYTLLQNYAQLRGNYKSDRDPFFIFSDGSPVLAQQLSVCLKRILKKCGFDETLYGTHSLRSGRMCNLYKFGLSVETIKKIGRWKSNAVFRYLKT